MTEKPRLPSQMHPEYPKMWSELREGDAIPTWHLPKPQQFVDFYAAHPEFQNEGEWLFICPFCGDENEFEDQGGYCCGEVGHCTWQYFEPDQV